MATIGDLKKLYEEVRFTMSLHGSTKESQEEFAQRCQLLGDAMLEDHPEETLKEVIMLPETTEFGPATEAHFQELKSWLATQHPNFRAFVH